MKTKEEIGKQIRGWLPKEPNLSAPTMLQRNRSVEQVHFHFSAAGALLASTVFLVFLDGILAFSSFGQYPNRMYISEIEIIWDSFEGAFAFFVVFAGLIAFRYFIKRTNYTFVRRCLSFYFLFGVALFAAVVLLKRLSCGFVLGPVISLMALSLLVTSDLKNRFAESNYAFRNETDRRVDNS